MQPDIAMVARDCTAQSDAGGKPFPEVVAALASAGIERYHADLIRAEKTYYLPDGEALSVPSTAASEAAPATLDPDGVAAAVRAAQAGLPYPEFRGRVVAAGCVGYHVSLSGRRAVYYGRDAAMHVEQFPD